MPRSAVFSRMSLTWWFETVFGKISTVFSTALFFLAGTQVLFVIHFWNRSLNRAEQLSQWNSAAYLAGVIESRTTDSVELGGLQRIVHEFCRANARATVYILDETGKIALSFQSDSPSSSDSIGLEPIGEFLKPGATQNAPILGDDPENPREPAVFSAAPLRFRGKPVILYILFSTDVWRNSTRMGYEDAMLKALASWFILSTLCTAAGVTVLFYLLARRFSKITATVRCFHDGDFSPRIGFTSNDELGLLGTTIDRMAEKIELSINALEERDRLRRDLIANVSHDLRGPLTNIQGNFELLERSGGRVPSAEFLSEYTLTVGRNLEYLSELLNQLFELAKMEAQELRPDFENFPIDQLIDDLVTGYQARAKENGIELEALIDERPVFVCGDIRILDRVLMNLIENALKFTPRGGKIILGVNVLPKSVRILVSDTGAGISAEDLPKIFAKFYQGKKAPKVKGSTGLGLAIVDRLLKLHKSSIGVESQVNRGTTFFFELARVDLSAEGALLLPEGST